MKTYLTLDFIQYLISCTVFFIPTSWSYMEGERIKYFVYFPIAYTKFMILMIKEYKPFKHEKDDIFYGKNI